MNMNSPFAGCDAGLLPELFKHQITPQFWAAYKHYGIEDLERAVEQYQTKKSCAAVLSFGNKSPDL
jgi:hypothetical protein